VNVLFVCVANSGRVMAERLIRAAADERHQACSVGSNPGSAPHPQVLEALRELGIDASDLWGAQTRSVRRSRRSIS
jgi:protein-tyrosine-phosphatase